MGNMGNYGTKRIGHLVIHSSTQKGNFNFAIKISKKLLAFGINWLLNAYLSLLSLNERIRCQSVSVTQWQSVYLSLKFSVSHLVSWSVLVCLLFVGQSISLSVCQKHATLGFRPCSSKITEERVQCFVPKLGEQEMTALVRIKSDQVREREKGVSNVLLPLKMAAQ